MGMMAGSPSQPRFLFLLVPAVLSPEPNLGLKTTGAAKACSEGCNLTQPHPITHTILRGWGGGIGRGGNPNKR